MITIATAIRPSQCARWEGAGSVVTLGLVASADAKAHPGDHRHWLHPSRCRAPVGFSCNYPCFATQSYKHVKRDRGVSSGQKMVCCCRHTDMALSLWTSLLLGFQTHIKLIYLQWRLHVLSSYFQSDALLQLFLVFVDLMGRPLSIEKLAIHVAVALSLRRHALRRAVPFCTYCLAFGTVLCCTYPLPKGRRF